MRVLVLAALGVLCGLAINACTSGGGGSALPDGGTGSGIHLGGGDGEGGAASAHGTVGAAGGTVATPDGRVTLVVPPGTFSEDTTITIAPALSAPPGAVAAFTITSTESVLAKPVTLTFAYQTADLAGQADTYFEVMQYLNAAGSWQAGGQAKSVVDATAKTVSTTVATLAPDYWGYGFEGFKSGPRCSPSFACPRDSTSGTLDYTYLCTSPTPAPGQPQGNSAQGSASVKQAGCQGFSYKGMDSHGQAVDASIYMNFVAGALPEGLTQGESCNDYKSLKHPLSGGSDAMLRSIKITVFNAVNPQGSSGELLMNLGGSWFCTECDYFDPLGGKLGMGAGAGILGAFSADVPYDGMMCHVQGTFSNNGCDFGTCLGSPTP